MYQSWEEALKDLIIDTYEEMNVLAPGSIHEQDRLQEVYREIDLYKVLAVTGPMLANENALRQRVIDYACEWKRETKISFIGTSFPNC